MKNTVFGIELSGSICEFNDMDQEISEFMKTHHENQLTRTYLHPLGEHGVEVIGEAVIPTFFSNSVTFIETTSSQLTTSRSRSKLFSFFKK